MEQIHKKKTSKPYSPEFRERAVRLAMEHRDEYQSEAAALTTIAGKLGCSPESLRVWVRQAEREGGERPGQTSAEKARIKELERENRELRQANEILKKSSAYLETKTCANRPGPERQRSIGPDGKGACVRLSQLEQATPGRTIRFTMNHPGTYFGYSVTSSPRPRIRRDSASGS